MKILYVIPSYEPAWAFGGTVTAVANLCRRLASIGIDITVYTTNADGNGGFLDVPTNQPLDVGGVKVWYFRCDFGLRKGFYSRTLARRVNESAKDYDLVHVSAIWQWHQRVVCRASKQSGTPYIISPHASLMASSLNEVGNRWLKQAYWHLVGKATAQHASAIHFLCEGERQESAELLSKQSSFIVPNGISFERFKLQTELRSETRRRLNIKESALVLLHLGRIHPKKNIDLVLDTMYKLRKKGVPDFGFIICGSIENKDYYQKLLKIISQYRLGDVVKWHDPVENKEVVRLFSAADLLVLPSKNEGISMVTIEAMAASLPVLVSNRVANYYEIQEDGAGVVVEPSVNSVVDALEAISGNRTTLKRLSENARQCAIKRYDITEVANLMSKAYKDVLDNTRHSELKWSDIN